jgi:hypothetical protein
MGVRTEADMASVTRRLGLLGVVLLGAGNSCSSSVGTTDGSQAAAAPDGIQRKDSHEAQDIVEKVRSRFRLPSPELSAIRSVPGEQPVLRDAVATGFKREGAWLLPSLPLSETRGLIHPARVALPARADGSFEVRDTDTGMWIEVSLDGAQDAEGDVTDGYVVYRRGYRSGAHVIHRVDGTGTEDYLAFETQAESRDVRYRVRFSDHVAGIRNVENTVEFLDLGGVPRIRVAPPYVATSQGQITAASVRVEGARYGSSLADPRHRAVTPPGSVRADVVVSLPVIPVSAYPILLDPAFTTTGATAVLHERYPIGVLVPDGRVILTSGASAVLTEAYERTTGTWATLGSMSTARQGSQGVLLPSGKLLVAGGISNGVVLSTAEVFDLGSSAWTPTGSMSSRRTYYGMSALASGLVLSAGGRIDTTNTATSTAELFNETTGTWTPAGSMAAARAGHAFATLADGRVLVAYGINVSTAELYDPTLGSWALTPTPPTENSAMMARATRLNDNRVFVEAGDNYKPKLFDPATNTWALVATAMPNKFDNTLSLLGGGKVLVTGGQFSTTQASLYDPTTNLWEVVSPMSYGRWAHGMTRLATGEVLVYGGVTSTKVAELFDVIVGGGTCVANGECSSGFCSDGVCCDKACTELCHACSAAAKGGGADGVCEPVVAGQDPRNDCIDDFPSCQDDGLCDGAGACQKYGNGTVCSATPCSANAQCTTGFCVDEVCCATACTGICQACSTAKKGAGLDGACEPVAVGSDPDNDCAPDLAWPTSCKADGMCDGQGKCRLFSPANVVCGDPTCATDEISGYLCNGTGLCVKSSQPCAPYHCHDAVACATGCSSNADCDATGWCRFTDWTCQLDLAIGAPCTAVEQCSTGFCIDGFCCDTDCAGLCSACAAALKASGVDSGKCGPAKQGMDPHDDCPDDGSVSCKRDGACNGTGACELFSAGTSCGSGSICEGNVAKELLCDGLGSCQVNQGTDCGPGKCSTGSCSTNCATSADCAEGAWCDGTACKKIFALGETCDKKDQCGPNFCVDTVCCNAPCDGQCEACDVEGGKGSCIAVSGAPHGNRSPCPSADAGDICEHATCEGTDRKACSGFVVGKDYQCRKPSCADGILTLGSWCDGKGHCPTSDTRSCNPYKCQGDACGTSCSANEQCADKYECDTIKHECVGVSATCDGDHTLVSKDGLSEDCTPYRCSTTNACLNRCTSRADCVAGVSCTADGRCEAEATDTSGDAGCGCKLSTASHSGLSAWLFLSAWAILLRSRRRKR